MVMRKPDDGYHLSNVSSNGPQVGITRCPRGVTVVPTIETFMSLLRNLTKYIRFSVSDIAHIPLSPGGFLCTLAE